MRTPLKSSQIRSAGVNPDTGNLEVEFNNGEVYHYGNVPIKLSQGLLDAPSPGKFFHANIKKFPGKKV